MDSLFSWVFSFYPKPAFEPKKKVVQVTIDKDPPMYDIYISVHKYLVFSYDTFAWINLLEISKKTELEWNYN